MSLELMARTVGYAIQKEKIRVRPPRQVGIISFISPLNEGLSLKHFIQDSRVDEGGDLIQHEVFQALHEGRDTISWDNTEALRSVRSRWTAEIFLAPDHTGGVHNAWVTQHYQPLHVTTQNCLIWADPWCSESGFSREPKIYGIIYSLKGENRVSKEYGDHLIRGHNLGRKCK